MEAKQKAAELIEIFENIIYQTITDTGNGVEAANLAKQCAIICCDEMWVAVDKNFRADPDKPSLSELRWDNLKEFYQSVKSEIEKY